MLIDERVGFLMAASVLLRLPQALAEPVESLTEGSVDGQSVFRFGRSSP